MALWSIRILFLTLCTVGGLAITQVRPEMIVNPMIGMIIGFLNGYAITRFNLAPLTKRDAAQKSMAEFFNFNIPSWMTPPTPPKQTTSGPCYLNALP